MHRRAYAKRVDGNIIPGEDRFDLGILCQEQFLWMLRLERKRTERSGRHFVLMLLDCSSLLKASIECDKALLAVTRATRETDVKGWYQDGQTFGVIFTEVDISSVATILLPNIRTALASSLDANHVEEIRLSVHVFPEDRDTNGDGNIVDPFLYPDLVVEMDRKRVSRMVKRFVDLTGSLFVLLLSTPLLLAIAVAVKLTSSGAVLFRQQRVGLNGRRFTCLKFRSMYTGCNETAHTAYMKSLIADQVKDGPKATFKMTGDSRVTPLGKLLRRTSLDELPQLFNVLKGEMSLVGPRPAIPYEVQCYNIWQRQRLLAVKPGITGLWQVRGRSRSKFSDMVRLDLQYARTWSLWLDIQILLETPRAVISGNGAH